MEKKKISIIYILIVVLFLISVLGPILYAGIISITPESYMLKRNANILPEQTTLSNYEEILDPQSKSHKTVFNGLKNSFKSALITIAIGIPIATISGYCFSKYKFKLKNCILISILITIVIPVFSTITPIYAIFARYDLLDKLFWLSIIYISAFLPTSIWLMKGYFDSIPEEILEAARVDGANEFQIFSQIILPISYPIILTCALIMFLMAWNQFQIPMILLSSQNSKIITIVLSEFVGRDAISYGLIAVAGLISILPPGLIAIVFRKFLISGLTSGAIKG